MWGKRKLLIYGKTSPEFSKKYGETVCTAAVDAETGGLVRIYPVPIGSWDQKLPSFTWIEATVQPNPLDQRPETRKVDFASIVRGGKISTEHGWAERARWLLRDGNVFPSVEALQNAQADRGTSLGLVKPAAKPIVIQRKRTEEDRQEWDGRQKEVLAALEQGGLFEVEDSPADRAAFIKALTFSPVKYLAQFSCNDGRCSGHELTIFDWEFDTLARRSAVERGPVGALKDVRTKWDQVFSEDRDTYLSLGNTVKYPKNFMIGGVFWPKKDRREPPEQKSLFG